MGVFHSVDENGVPIISDHSILYFRSFETATVFVRKFMFSEIECSYVFLNNHEWLKVYFSFYLNPDKANLHLQNFIF